MSTLYFSRISHQTQKRFEKLFKKCQKSLKYKGLRYFQGGIFFVNTPQQQSPVQKDWALLLEVPPLHRTGFSCAPMGARKPVRIRREAVGKRLAQRGIFQRQACEYSRNARNSGNVAHRDRRGRWSLQIPQPLAILTEVCYNKIRKALGI